MTRRTDKDATLAIHAGKGARDLPVTVNPPIQRGSTLMASNAKALYDGSENTYGRSGLSPHDALKDALAALEGAAGVQLYPSGLGAISGALLSVLKAGDEVLSVDCIYEPSRRFFDNVLKRYGVPTRYFGAGLSAEAVLALASERTRVIYLESPGSLSFDMQDVAGIAAAARTRGILTVMDNTYGAGLLFKPIAQGVDISIQALTKYVGGHADVFMGSAAAATDSLARLLEAGQLHFGWATSPDDAYQMLRGLRTLPTRLARHGESTLKIVAWLNDQPQIAEVLCPALPGASGHELFERDYAAPNGLFSMVLQPAPEAAVLAFLDALELFGLGFSWGGYESLAVNCDPQFGKRTAGKPAFAGPMIRLHVGLEDPDDLIADLARALAAFEQFR